MNSKLMVEALKYKQTSQPKMISNILNCLQQGIKEESYQPLYPINSKQMERQLSLLQIPLGLISVILDALGTDGFQDARNIEKKLFYSK